MLELERDKIYQIQIH